MADQSPKKKRGCLSCLGYVALGLIALVVLAVIASRETGPAVPPGALSGPPTPAVAVGSEGILAGPATGGNGTWIAATFGDFGPMVEAQAEIPRARAEGRAGGCAAEYRMAEADRIRIVANGTRVRVKEMGTGSVHVDLLDGEDKGRSGWVQAEFVRPAP